MISTRRVRCLGGGGLLVRFASMATRAPRKPARSRDEFDQAALEALGFDDRGDRGGARPKPSRQGTSKARSTSAKPAASRSGARPPAKKRPPARKRPAPAPPPKSKGSHDPFVILASWLGRAIL